MDSIFMKDIRQDLQDRPDTILRTYRAGMILFLGFPEEIPKYPSPAAKYNYLLDM